MLFSFLLESTLQFTLYFLGILIVPFLWPRANALPPSRWTWPPNTVHHQNASSSSFFNLFQMPTWQRSKDGQFPDQATIEQSAFMPGWQPLGQLACLSHNWVSLHAIPTGLWKDGTANIILVYSRTHIKFITLFQFYVEVHYVQYTTLSDIFNSQRVEYSMGKGKQTPVQRCDHSYSSQHRQHSGSWGEAVVWSVREISLLFSAKAPSEFSAWEVLLPSSNSRGWYVSIFMFPFLWLWSFLLSRRLLTWFAGSVQTTGMMLALLRLGTSLIPVELLLLLDLQDGGVVVQDGKDDFVHVLSQT